MNLQNLSREQLIKQYMELEHKNAALKNELHSMREKEARFMDKASQWELILERAPLSVLIWRRVDNDLILQHVSGLVNQGTNGYFSNKIGVSAKKIFEQRPEVVDYLEACLKRKKHLRNEYKGLYWGQTEERKLSSIVAYISPEIIMTIINDVTEQKKSEEALRESEEPIPNDTGKH